MGRLVALLRVYSDYRSDDPFVDTIKQDFPVVYAVRSRVNRMLRRLAEFIEKGPSEGTAPAMF
jgi:hypothetical protein